MSAARWDKNKVSGQNHSSLDLRDKIKDNRLSKVQADKAKSDGPTRELLQSPEEVREDGIEAEV